MNDKTLQIKNFPDIESRAIWILKSFAILSVVAAHVNKRVDDTYILQLVTNFWELYGNCGVIIFLIISGYLGTASNGNYSVQEFWSKKLKSIIIPWLFCSTLTYIIGCILGGEVDAAKWFDWVIGHYTWYYFMVVQIILFFLLPYLIRWNTFLMMAIVLNIVCLFLNGIGFDFAYYNEPITPYQDIANWIGFFCIGILLQKYSLLSKIEHIKIIALVIAILTFGSAMKYEIYGYFNLLAMLRELSAAILLWNVAVFLAKYTWSRLLVQIGKYSFCIYLLHMQIVQPVCSRLGNSLLACLFRPIVGILIMYVLIKFGKLVVKKSLKAEFIESLVGLR